MGYEQKPNSGSLFKNDRKETDQHPDYTGTLDVDGRQFWLSSWVRTTSAGKKYLSLAIKPRDGGTSKPVIDDEIQF
jgi:hypothetical protein